MSCLYERPVISTRVTPTHKKNRSKVVLSPHYVSLYWVCLKVDLPRPGKFDQALFFFERDLNSVNSVCHLH